MSRIVDTLHRVVTQISKPTAIIGILGLLAIACVTLASVTARAVFNSAIVWAHDAASLIIIIVVATCFPTGVLLRKHVAIEFLGGALGPRWTRILDTFGAVITTVALAVLAWQMTVIAGQEVAYNSTTTVARIPTGPVWWAAAIIVCVSVPMQVIVTLRIAAGTSTRDAKEDHV
ncbi:TRAP transporter small permease [Gymnodinialimonas sp. 57CJ19]|uniref:TRAP transporter small permease n=1 Tax=Gymnodinialimonas sp. 57CJ19 TaxID=3138498 RepID=UPI0031343570